nr:hypothetical protein CFP56_55286 [Quercus suber]
MSTLGYYLSVGADCLPNSRQLKRLSMSLLLLSFLSTPRVGKPAARSILLRLRLIDYAIKSSKFCSLKINMCGNIKSHSVWEGHELVILALEIKECLNFANSPIESFPKGGKRSAFLRRTSTSFSTPSIKEFQNPRSLDKRPRLKQMPVDGIS